MPLSASTATMLRSLQRQLKEVQMKRQRTNRLGSMIATALNALALVSVARMIGPKRMARVAALATEGYFTRLRRGRPRR
jgi:uridylate kinase